MKPPKRETTFEKLKIGEMLPGAIEDIEYDISHKFSFKGEDKISPGVRFVFKVDGYQYHHRSRWMKFNAGEKSNLYKMILSKLVSNAKPDMEFDIDHLKGLRVKTLWAENNDFQNLESVFPEDEKVLFTTEDAPMEEEPLEEPQA